MKGKLKHLIMLVLILDFGIVFQVYADFLAGNTGCCCKNVGGNFGLVRLLSGEGDGPYCEGYCDGISGFGYDACDEFECPYPKEGEGWMFNGFTAGHCYEESGTNTICRWIKVNPVRMTNTKYLCPELGGGDGDGDGDKK